MSRINEDEIIIGGGDEIDEMERAGRMISETAQLIDEIPVIEDDGDEAEDLSAEITIGGGDDDSDDWSDSYNDWSDDDPEEESDGESDEDEESEITIGGDIDDDDDDDDDDGDDDDDDDDGDDDDDDNDDDDDDDDDDDIVDYIDDSSITIGEPEVKRERLLRSKRSGRSSGAPVPIVGPRDLEAVRAKKAKAKEKAAQANAYDDDGGDFRKEYLVTASPHLHCGETTRVIMQDVIVALMPAALVSVVYFGWRAAITLLVCVVSCVLSEYICRRVMKRPQTIGDYSAAVTGVLLAFCLPPEINPIFAAIGSIVAIVVVKQMFGGIGMNFANPAATARIVLMLSFPVAMTTWSRPFYYLGDYYDAVTTPTPLAALKDPTAEAATLRELFFGFHQGSMGEVCAVALMLGGAYLLIRGIISWHIPVSFIGTVALFALVTGEDPLYHVLAGGVMLGAFFMATDYVTSPSSKWGKIIFGVGCGLFTMLIRLYGSMVEGVSFAILLMNILTPHIEKLTAGKPYGEERGVA